MSPPPTPRRMDPAALTDALFAHSVASRSCTTPPCAITIAQITTTRGRAGLSMASMGAQGRHGAVENWKENEITWRFPGSGSG